MKLGEALNICLPEGVDLGGLTKHSDYSWAGEVLFYFETDNGVHGVVSLALEKDNRDDYLPSHTVLCTEGTPKMLEYQDKISGMVEIGGAKEVCPDKEFHQSDQAVLAGFEG